MISSVLVLAFVFLSSTRISEGQVAPYANGTCDDRRPPNTKLVVRKNLTALTSDEVQRLRDVFSKLMALDKVQPGNNCTYFNVAKHHGWFTATCQHETTTCFQHGFLPWHRVYMYEIEQAMRKIDPDISLPYWDFTSIYSPSRDTPVQDLLPRIVTEMYYHNSATKRTEFNPLYTYTIPSIPGVDSSPSKPTNTSRNIGKEGGILQFVRDLICSSFPLAHLDVFSRQYECPHNYMHNFQGGFFSEYSMSSQRWTAFDPIFWFYHSNIDRIWAGWEEHNDDFTSAFISKTDFFYPYRNWPFEYVSDYKKTMYYTYDKTFTTDFCPAQPMAGSLALYAQFTHLPIAYTRPYNVRLIIDPQRAKGNHKANTLLTNDNIVAEISMWRAMSSNCSTPGCSTWCPSPPLNSKLQLNSSSDKFFQRPFNISDALFVDVYDNANLPIDISSGIHSDDLRTRLIHKISNSPLPVIDVPQLSYGKVVTAKQYLATAVVSKDKKEAHIDWHFQSPDTNEYPPIHVATGAKLNFTYYAADHSVAQVFANEYKLCPAFVLPQCYALPGHTGQFNCIIELDPKVTNTTLYFICTQSDHCATRGMRIQVKVGDGMNVPCKDFPGPNCAEPPCPEHGTCRPHGAGQYPNGTTIIYSCDQGYNLVGYQSIQCLDDGMWTSNPPKCVPAKTTCPEPACPKYASCDSHPATTPSYPTGSTIRYACGSGYDLIGESSSRCLHGGMWSSNPPLCRKVMTAADL